jgi:beta-glucosidase
VVEAGAFAIEVGTHSRDLPLSQTITLDAPSIAAPLTRDSTLHEWMSDPIGRRVLGDAMAAGQSNAVMDDELLGVVGTMPMSTLANFGGMSLDHEALDEAVTTWQRRALQQDPVPANARTREEARHA